MKLRFANVVALLVGFAMVVQALPAGAGQFKAAQLKTAGQVRSEESKAKSPVKDPLPAADPDWDPKDPAAVQYADGAWGIAYVDNANPPNLLFRRSLGGGDPQYWRDQLTVESAAERPSMVQLGGTTALFYGKMSGGVREAFLKTSTDDGATWSSPTQLTSGSPAHVYEINTVNVDGTIHMFYSLSNTSGQLQYKTSSDLANWSAASTVGQPIGPLQSSTIPTFDIEMLASGEWAMSWLNVSIAGGGGQPINDLGWPVVWFGKSADLASSSWSNKSELMAGSPFGMRFPKSVTLAQDSAGTVKVAFESQRYPSDQYIYAVSSADAGTTFTGAELVGYEPTRSTNGSGDSYARRPYAVATNEGPVRLFWDMEVPIWAGSYPAQLFRRDLTPGAGITQISVSKEQMAKCGPCVPTGAFVADPINATTGNFTLPETDFMIPGKGPSLSFTRTYNAHRLVDSPLGFGWTHNFAESVQTFSRGEALVIDGTGRNDLYTPKAGGGYDPPPGRFATLVQNPDTTFTLTETDFTVKTFNQDGHLSSITDRFGNSLSLAYDPGQELTSVTDESGRTLTFAYQGNRISTITDPLNRTVGYGYSPAGDLISITDPRAKVWTHTYNANHQMLTKKDPNNNTVLTNTYVSLGRVGTQTDARGGVTRFDYNAGGGRTDVVNPRGHTTHYYFDTSYRVTKIYDQNLKMINRFYDDRDNLIRVEDRRRSPFNNTYFTYDSRGNVLTRKDGLNKTWTYTYNAFNQVLTETDPMGRENCPGSCRDFIAWKGCSHERQETSTKEVLTRA